jgi:hypothetical protein
MTIYPIRVPRPHYRGANPVKRAQFAEKARIAQRLEDHINSQMEGHEIQTFTYGFIAAELKLPLEQVKDLLFAVDAGHNGLTVCTREYWDSNMR